MRFKRSHLLSVGLVVGYLSRSKKNKIKKIKVRRKQVIQIDSHLHSQISLIGQDEQSLATKTYLPKTAKAKKRAFTIQQLFEMYEQSYHDILYLEAVKFLLEQIFWESANSSEE